MHPRPPGYEPGELLLLHPAISLLAPANSFTMVPRDDFEVNFLNEVAFCVIVSNN